jgi:hypothetical protein
LRKLLTGAIAASATLAIAAGAIADPNDSEATLNVKVSPTDSGTARKPKNEKLNFNLSVNKPQTTVEVIEVNLPKGLKFSGKGFKKCNIDDLLAVGVTGCSAGSKAGPKGTANALLGAENAPLDFDVYPYVENANTLLFYLTGPLQTAIRGKITDKGRKLSITIPFELRQPGNQGLDATLTGIDQTFSGKSGKHYIVSSTRCTKKKWAFSGTLRFTARADGAPVPAPETRDATVRCKK